MRYLSLVLVFLIWQPDFLQAQGWQQTSGPSGGNVRTVAAVNESVLAGMWNGNIYRTDGADWKALPQVEGIQEFSVSGNTVFALTYSGLLRSEDIGETWIPILRAESSTFSSIVKGPDALYFLVNDSLYRSSDGGESWKFRSRTDAGATLLGFSGGYIIAAGGFSGVVASSDKGLTWIRRDQSLPEGALVTSMVTVKDDDNGRTEVWVSILSKGVYYTKDGGEEWEQECDGLPKEYNDEYPTFSQIYAANERLYGVANQMVYEWNNDDDRWNEAPQLVGKNIQAYGDDLYASGADGVLRSQNDGVTWNTIGGAFLYNNITGFASAKSALLALSASGIYRTDDQGITWTKTGVFQSQDISAGHGVAYAESLDGIMRSTDDGLTWDPANSGIDEMPSDLQTLSANSTTAFAGYFFITGMHGSSRWASGGIYRSTDGGLSWAEANNGIATDGYVHAPMNKVVAFDEAQFGLAVDGLYRSTDNGEQWSKFVLPIDQQNDMFYDLERIGNQLFLASHRKMFRSVDMGLTWEQFTNGLNVGNEGLYGCVVLGDTLLLKSYELGVGTRTSYRLDGNTWIPFALEAPKGVEFTEFFTHKGRVYAGTTESSVWSRPALTSSVDRTNTLPVTVRLYPNPFATTTTVHFTLPGLSQLSAAVYDMNGRLVRDLGTHMAQGEQQLVIDGEGLPAGTYLCRVTTEQGVFQVQMVLQP